jgi:KTSC domain/Putative amidoligase enzyme
MSCRETAAGSLATSLGRMCSGLSDVQAISVFHGLIREGRDRPAPTADQVRAWAANARQDINTRAAGGAPGLNGTRQASLLARVERVQGDPTLDGPTFHACANIDVVARQAHAALAEQYQRLAGELGVPVEEVTVRARQYEREAAGDRRGGQRRAAPQPWRQQFLGRPGTHLVPQDRATLYALHRLEEDAATRHPSRPPDPTQPRPDGGEDTPVGRQPGGEEPPRWRVTRQPLDHGVIAAVGYDPNDGRLEVEFHPREGTGPRVYAYRNVPAQVYQRMVAPDASPIAVYTAWVRGNPAYTYASAAEADTDAVARRCPNCGQDTGLTHPCRGPGDPQAAQPRLRSLDPAGMRTYRGDQVELRMPDVAAIRSGVHALAPEPDGDDGVAVPVTIPVFAVIRMDQGSFPLHTVLDGEVQVEPVGDQLRVVNARGLPCHCRAWAQLQDCRHVQLATGQLEDQLNGRRRGRDPDRVAAAAAVAEDLAARRAASLAAQQHGQARWGTGFSSAANVSYVEQFGRFQRAYREAKTRQGRGEPPIPYLTEHATDGLGSRFGGRGFGVEIEFDLAGDDSWPEGSGWSARQRIGQALYDAGLTDSPYQHDYHSHDGVYTDRPNGWRYEHDITVTGGELISPILYDEPETWRNLARACEVIREHGGAITTRAGGHIHVGMGDYDHSIAAFNKLLGLFAEHQDVLYRLAQNPAARAHRGLSPCAPNLMPASGYSSVQQVFGANRNRGGVNLAAVSGSQQDHGEFRLWDGALDEAVIQTRVKLSLALTAAGLRDAEAPSYAGEPLGTHRARNRGRARGERLAGEAWRSDTLSFRRLMDALFVREQDKAQAAALFAVTRWQRGTGRS